MSAATHAVFSDIVLKGTLADKGMGDFSDLLNQGQVKALHTYLINESWRHYDRAMGSGEWHKAAH